MIRSSTGSAAIKEIAEEKYYVASQWRLFRWKLFRHKIAIVSMAILGVFYLTAIFAEFVAPHDPLDFNKELVLAPIQRIHLIDDDGKFHLQPFVYKIEKTVGENWQLIYTEDRSVRYPIRLFVRGDSYMLWGIIPGNLHLFGTEKGMFSLLGRDRGGRDLFSRVVYASRVSLSIGLLGVAISLFIGVLIGGISGYYGGKIDLVIQRIIEALRSIPTLPLWAGLRAALPYTWPMMRIYFAIIVILSLVGWTGMARVVRGKFLALRSEDFVVAAKVSGSGDFVVIFRHLLPSFLSHIIATVTLAVPGMILAETSLSFIGLGLQAPAVSWGVLLQDAQSIESLAGAPWLLTPAIFVVVSILAFNFLGDGLRDAADPYAEL